MKGNLLIVDDETDLLITLEYYLKDLADKIYTCENGKDALVLLATHEIHCILCDINMPEMNGVELIKIIRGQGRDVPFIFYTGHGSHSHMLEAAKYGAFDFLNKPHLDGIQGTISRGLAKGLGKDNNSSESQEFMSEFRKLLKDSLG